VRRHVQVRRLPLLTLEAPDDRRAVLAPRQKAQPKVGPLDGVHPVVVRFSLENPVRSFVPLHVVDSDVVVRRPRRQKGAPRTERRADHLGLSRPHLLLVHRGFAPELHFAPGVVVVGPEGDRTVGAGGDQVLEVPRRGGAKIHRGDHTGVPRQDGDRDSALQVPDPEDPVDGTRRQ
jgi:hypothetical protein